MKLFEFDISWDQTIRHQFDQDDIKAIGTRRVESDNVRVLAPDLELAKLALSRSFSYHNMEIRTPPREIPLHIIVEYSVQTIKMVSEVRAVGPEVLNRFGEEMKKAGAL